MMNRFTYDFRFGARVAVMRHSLPIRLHREHGPGDFCNESQRIYDTVSRNFGL